jgi:hypothetical protein
MNLTILPTKSQQLGYSIPVRLWDYVIQHVVQQSSQVFSHHPNRNIQSNTIGYHRPESELNIQESPMGHGVVPRPVSIITPGCLAILYIPIVILPI